MGCTGSKTARKDASNYGVRESARRAEAARAEEQARAAAELGTSERRGREAGGREQQQLQFQQQQLRRLRRPPSRVDQQRDLYEALDRAAKAPPSLEPVSGVIGARSRRLLEGFEAKEAEASRKPELVSVDRKDLRTSLQFAKMLGDYEEKDATAALEPKLEKTFVQREKESIERLSELVTVSRR